MLPLLGQPEQGGPYSALEVTMKNRGHHCQGELASSLERSPAEIEASGSQRWAGWELTFFRRKDVQAYSKITNYAIK